MNREVTTAAVVGVLALGAAGAGFAKDRDGGRSVAPDAGAAVRADPFVGGDGQRVPSAATRAARRSARGAGRAQSGSVVAVRDGATIALHDRPGGRVLTTIGDRTPFGSQQVLAVVRRRPGWLGVFSSVIGNGQVAWIRDRRDVLAHDRSPVRIEVDRSDQRLDLLRGRRRVMSVAVGVGRAGSETPTGRFAVTDRISGSRYPGSYGCCILALTGRQARLPSGWRGGNRLAIHGTGSRSAASVRTAGCLAADRAPLERLMRTVPLGTVVTIRP